jgi:hypothetical protein
MVTCLARLLLNIAKPPYDFISYNGNISLFRNKTSYIIYAKEKLEMGRNSNCYQEI